MKKVKLLVFALSIGAITSLNSCKKDEATSDTTTTHSDKKDLVLNVSGLEDVGKNYNYEGWLIVDGKPVSAGIFSVDGLGKPSKTSFSMDTATLRKSTAYVLTIEPNPDKDPKPSSVHVLAGDFGSNTTANLTVKHKSALGVDFANVKGSYILATPTDGNMTANEESGIWWLKMNAGTPSASLTLPTLPAGWKYEGWVVMNGVPLTTGKFTKVSGSDESAPFSETKATPPFPGEDFLKNAPAGTGINFPFNLSNGKAVTVISVEPEPDNSVKPFLLKPLKAGIPITAKTATSYDMNKGALPGGTAKK